jgi:hypothetical protein
MAFIARLPAGGMSKWGITAAVVTFGSGIPTCVYRCGLSDSAYVPFSRDVMRIDYPERPGQQRNLNLR